jgi:hypothetical protein
MTWLSVLATVVATLAAAASGVPAQAAQASGDDVVAWNTGWAWTYQTTFRYTGDSADVTINENVTYTVAGVESFQGHSAYKLNITGTITGGSGTATTPQGNASLSNFSGSVSGTKYVRRSDLALLQEKQHQNLSAKASISIISVGITAAIDLDMVPRGGWRALDFPIEAGQSWQNNVDVDYTGGFTYDAGSLGGTGGSPFDGTFSLNAPASVSNANATAPIGNVPARKVHSQSADGSMVSTHWWSPNHRNDAQEYLKLPLDGATLTIDRKLTTASTPAASTTLTETITPSLACGGADVTVEGRLSTGAAGVPVTITLDKSPLTPGLGVTVNTTTTANGNYSATIAAPGQADGLQKNGVRGSWGVLVTAGGVTNAATLVVTPKNCSTLTYTGATGAPQGTNTTLRAKLVDPTGDGVAGRTVTFSLSGGATATATTDAAGVAETQIAVAGPPRSATVTASYAGDAGHEPASASSAFTVGTIPTTTTVVADPGTVTIGDPVRFTATVAPSHGGSPAGTVQFRVDGADFGSPVALTNGQATSAALSTLGLGMHSVVAVYGGTADHTASTSSTVDFRVRVPLLGTSTAASVSPSNAVYGQPVTLSATVSTGSGTPTGDVVFTVGSTEVGRAGVGTGGNASLVVTDLPVGSNAVVATYTGDDVYGASAASPRSVTVSKANVAVSLDASASHTVSGEAVSFTATVAAQAPGGGTPAGSVQLLVDGTAVGSPVALDNGIAAFAPVTSLRAGTHTVEARYAGNANYASGADQAQQVVSPADTTTVVQAIPATSVEDQNVTLTAAVTAVSPGSGAPSGTVTFFADGESLGAVPVSASASGSTASLDVDDLAPGSHQITARYAGDDDYTASESEAVGQTVIAGTAVVGTTTALTASDSPSAYGWDVTFTATVAAADDSTPTGTVQFSVDGQDVGSPVAVDANGKAVSPAVSHLEVGDHTVIASFVAASGYSDSGALLTHTVALAAAHPHLTSSKPTAGVGESVRFTVDVTSASGDVPSGAVQFRVDGHALGAAVALVDGSATSIAVDDLAPGDHLVTVLYAGDGRYGSATDELTQHVVQVTTTTGLTVSPGATTYGDAVLLTATVTPQAGTLPHPTGAVTFLANGSPIGTVSLAPGTGDTSVATLTTTSLPAGTHTLKAVYAGNGAFQGSSSSTRSLTVAKLATAMTAAPAAVALTPLMLPLGQLRATVTGGGAPVAGVPVEFRAGTKLLCTATTNESGTAVCNAGSQILLLTAALGYTATFPGDANHLSSTARGALIK